MNIENSNNVVAASIDAGGNVIVGDGNIVINLKEAADYKELQSQLERLNERFEKTQTRINNHPDDEDFKTELLQLSGEQNEVKEKLEALKAAVIKLAEDFLRIPLNTERLRLARQYFEQGQFAEARAILGAEAMTSELGALKQEQESLKQKIAENELRLRDKANEFLILARLTAVDFSLPDRFEKTKEYFEQSLSAAHNEENVFAYAYFLQEHNQFKDSLPLYREALETCRSLAAVNP